MTSIHEYESSSAICTLSSASIKACLRDSTHGWVYKPEQQCGGHQCQHSDRSLYVAAQPGTVFVSAALNWVIVITEELCKCAERMS
jgi:hypothetical protein